MNSNEKEKKKYRGDGSFLSQKKTSDILVSLGYASDELSVRTAAIRKQKLATKECLTKMDDNSFLSNEKTASILGRL